MSSIFRLPSYYARVRLRWTIDRIIDCVIRLSRPRISGIARSIDGGIRRRERKRLCVFAHFDCEDVIDDYVLNYLHELYELGVETIFCTTCVGLSDEQIFRIKPLCSLIILRQNIGYDFASYREGLLAAGDLSSYSEVIIANDSVYGPVFDLSQVFDEMADADADFWGITDSHEFRRHLQSYFVVFRKSVVASSAFNEFWSGLANHVRKKVLILNCEIGLSDTLVGAGFRMAALCEYDRIYSEDPSIRETFRSRLRGGRHLNTSHHLWQRLIERYYCPFIKVELLRDDPEGMVRSDHGWVSVLSENSDYDLSLIERHLARVSACRN